MNWSIKFALFIFLNSYKRLRTILRIKINILCVSTKINKKKNSIYHIYVRSRYVQAIFSTFTPLYDKYTFVFRLLSVFCRYLLCILIYSHKNAFRWTAHTLYPHVRTQVLPLYFFKILCLVIHKWVIKNVLTFTFPDSINP